MNVEKVGFSVTDCKPRRLEFIKYSNDKYMSNKGATIDESYEKSILSVGGLVTMNFLA